MHANFAIKTAAKSEALSLWSLLQKLSLLILISLVSTQTVQANTCVELFESKIKKPGLLKSVLQSNEIIQLKLRFQPTRTLAPLKDGIMIQGHTTMSKDEVLDLQHRIIQYDKFYANMGFRTAQDTRVLLVEKNKFNIGPFAMPDGLKLGFWPIKSKYWTHLVIEPTDVDFQRIPSVILHERAHLIISNIFYSSESPYTHPLLQEAMADIFAAHYLNDPVIGQPPGEKRFIRNIETREAISLARKNVVLFKTMKQLSDKALTPHERSLFISSFLWRIRQSIGPVAFGQFLYTFAHNIESNAINYEIANGTFGSFTSIEFIHNMVKKSAKDLNMESEVIPVADAYLKELEVAI